MRTIVNDPIQQFRFRVEIDGVEFGARNVSGLEKEIEVAEYAEGGFEGKHKLPGRYETGVLTIERGSFPDKTAYDLVNEALTKSNFRKTITVIEQNRLGEPVKQWTVTEAWASKITAPEFDAESSDVAVEQMEIQYEDLRLEIL